MYSIIPLKTLNEKIKQLRQINGFSKEYVASFLNVSESEYDQMEQNGGIPAQIILEFSALYDIEPELLISGNTESNPCIMTVSPKEKEILLKIKELSKRR